MTKVRKTALFIAVSITFVFCSMIIYFSTLSFTSKSDNTETEVLATVIVASYNIKANSILKNQDLKELKIPEKYVIPGSIKSTKEVIGKITKENIYEGEQILGGNIYGENDKERLSVQIPRGYRAITLKLDSVNGLAGNIKNGDYVDILGLLKPPYMQKETAVTIFENVYIIDYKASGDYYLITFYMKPEDINKLVLIEEIASIRISLRYLDDREAAPVSQIDTTILR